MRTSAPYISGVLRPGDEVITGEDEPWAGHSSGLRTEQVLWVSRVLIRTDHGWYFTHEGRQTRLQPLLHPRRLLSMHLAD